MEYENNNEGDMLIEMKNKILKINYLIAKFKLAYYVFHDRVTLFFADNFSMECQIIVKFLHNFF